jgi:pantothenate kinase
VQTTQGISDLAPRIELLSASVMAANYTTVWVWMQADLSRFDHFKKSDSLIVRVGSKVHQAAYSIADLKCLVYPF